MRLHSVTVAKPADKHSAKLYFMLSTVALLYITVLVAACLGAFYLFGSLFYQNRLRAYS